MSGGNSCRSCSSSCLQGIGDGHRVAVGLAVDVQQHGVRAVGRDDVELRCLRPADVGDVADANGCGSRPATTRSSISGRVADAVVDDGQIELAVLLVHAGGDELVVVGQRLRRPARASGGAHSSLAGSTTTWYSGIAAAHQIDPRHAGNPQETAG